jgi:hypothetical protein
MIKKVAGSLEIASKIHKQIVDIEKKLSHPISPRECFQLFLALDETSGSLKELKKQSLKTKNLFMQMQNRSLEEIQEKIVYLYGKAIDQKIDFQVKEIDQAAQKILHLISTGKILQISSETTTLKIYIQDLLHFHRLSKENLEIVNKANDILKMAFHHIP